MQQPLTDVFFSSFELHPDLLSGLEATGFTRCTPIQALTLPEALKGVDVAGQAQTGTGKTGAFLVATFQRLLTRDALTERRTGDPRALILAPTRELAAQIADSIKAYSRFEKTTHAVVVGGVKAGPQVRAMAGGVDILVATPGRLEDLMASGAIRLNETTKVVLDEADQMLDLGFMPAIRRILAKLPKQRQTVLLSATMPKEIRRLADAFLKDPVEISVAPASRPIERIDQSVIHLPHAEKRAELVKVLGNGDVERAIVFTRTKRGADRVSDHLVKAGLQSAAIHGNKSQGQRERALGAFKAGRVNILVATDIAARGIDIDDVSHVVNFELPNVPESYVHRIGRTARAGKSGTAVSFCDPEERKLLRDIERLIGRSLGGADEAIAVAPAGSSKRELPQPQSVQKTRRKRRRSRKKQNAVAPVNAVREANVRREGQVRNEQDRTGLARMLGNIASPQIA